MHKDIHTDALLLFDSICHVLVDLLLVVSITQLTLLMCQTCTSDGCITVSNIRFFYLYQRPDQGCRKDPRQSLTATVANGTYTVSACCGKGTCIAPQRMWRCMPSAEAAAFSWHYHRISSRRRQKSMQWLSWDTSYPC